jgi:hypothetical protein
MTMSRMLVTIKLFMAEPPCCGNPFGSSRRVVNEADPHVARTTVTALTGSEAVEARATTTATCAVGTTVCASLASRSDGCRTATATATGQAGAVRDADGHCTINDATGRQS